MLRSIPKPLRITTFLIKTALNHCHIYCVFILFVSVITHGGTSSHVEEDRYEFTSVHMGTEFRISLYAPNENIATKAATAAFNRIEELNSILSDYLTDSELNELSHTAGSGKEVVVSDILFEVLNHAVKISRQTDGNFDVTVGPYTQIWRGIRRELDPALPGEDEIASAAEKVGYQYILLNEERRTVKLLKKEMRLDLGGIAKGYAADEALRIISEFGIHSALVNGGGDISAGNAPPDRSGWRISIPLNTGNEEDIESISLNLANKAVSTSGDLFQHINIDGKTYSHIIDPHTGLGITTPIQVTVIATKGIDADAYASALSVMGFEKAKSFVKNSSELEVLIRESEEGQINLWISKGFNPDK